MESKEEEKQIPGIPNPCESFDCQISTSIGSRTLAEQVFSRAAGAPLVGGNNVRILVDAGENYPAWMDCLETATRTIHFEMFIIREDEIGIQFADILARKAREGVQVRILYDWLGGLFKTSRRFWQRLREAGVEVRCFNPPRLDSPIGWISRDHRKVIVVDGRVAFVTGLCIGQMWVGYPGRAIEPWRDTGVEIRGPAVADVESAFAQVWAVSGTPLATEEIPARDNIAPAGEVALRVIATVPNMAGLYRLDNLVAVLARRSLWLSDAYFVGVSSYVQALISAARDGVDVRLMVPGSTDIPVLRAITKSGFQPLLEAGVRVFEWNGPMMHAKTAVADGLWARVGSTNLNIASWMGNYELDVAVEDAVFAGSMEEMFVRDLENCTEIVLSRPAGIGLAGRTPRPTLCEKRSRGGSTGLSGAGTIRVGYTVGAALTEHRILGHAEAKITGIAGVLSLLVALAGAVWPLAVSIPLTMICGWLAISLLVRTRKLYSRKDKETEISCPKDNGPSV